MNNHILLELRAAVEAKVETSAGIMAWEPGQLIGRTLEAKPRYDVTLADGRMVGNLPADHVRPLAPAQEKTAPFHKGRVMVTTHHNWM